MKKIDTSEWKEFPLYHDELFDIDSGNKFDRSKMSTTEPSVNFIGRTGQNNGVNAFVDKINGIEPYPAGYITVALGGSIGAAFVQPKPFYTSQNVIVLRPRRKMSDYIKEYICIVISKESNLHYQAFVKELNAHIKKDFVVTLPAVPTGKPNWTYMEEYMREIESVVKEKISKLEVINEKEKKRIDIREWKEFRVGDLFDVTAWTYGKNKEWVQDEVITKTSIPVISGITINNGVFYYTSDNYCDDECFSDCLTITTRGEYSGTVKYHEEKFLLANNILAMPMPNLSKNIGLFLSVVLNNLGYGGYSNYPKKDTLENDIIRLPATSSGEPDWVYMETYMKNIELKAKEKVNFLTKSE